MKQDGEAVIVRGEEQNSDEEVHVFFDSVFCIGPRALDSVSASKIVEKKQT